MANLKNVTIDNTGFLQYPKGTQSQRPPNPTLGMVRYNTEIKNLEHYNGTEWIKTSTGEPSSLGASISNPAPSATTILNNEPSSSDGYYFIKPHNSSQVYYVYCDMTTDGGGWMMMINVRPNNGGQYYNNNDYGLSTIDGISGVPEYNKSITSMFSRDKINDFFKMSGFKYTRITPGDGVTINSPFTGLYQRVGTSISFTWGGTDFEASNRVNILNNNPWVLTQYQNWNEVQSGTNGQTGTYTGSNHYFPHTYDGGNQNFWKGNGDGIRWSSDFRSNDYNTIGQNATPGHLWIKSEV